MNSSTLTLAIVLPCFNEQNILPKSIAILAKNLQILIDKNIISKDSFCYFVDAGSQDNTRNIIVQNNHNNPNIKGLKLVANCGHQNALMAGLSSVMNKVDCTISMDVDLQNDINVIEKMINHYIAGLKLFLEFRYAIVEYKRLERQAGETKIPFN